MELIPHINGKKISSNKKAIQLIDKLKTLIHQHDKNAEIILFGSRARGDWYNESDWDFLILTNLPESETFSDYLRIKITNEIEFVLDEAIFVMIKNKLDWEEQHSLTNLYQSILEDGIAV